MSRYLLSFVIGAVFGALLMRMIFEPGQDIDKNSTITMSSVEIDGASLAPDPDPLAAAYPAQTTAVISSVPALPSAVDASPTIPAVYKQIMGPAVRHLSFGEKYEIFEAEPIDVPWAQGMETGINSYLARSGPETGSVFDFVQCRSSSCVLAGYSLPGHELPSAGIIREMRKEGWWQGGTTAISSGGRDDQNVFVVMLSRD